MFYKGMLRKCIAVLLVILTFVFNVSVGGAEKTARLRNCLENDLKQYRISHIKSE